MKHQHSHDKSVKVSDDELIYGKDIDLEKIYVECICPKCGEKHFMNFPWTGRGTPRKFCPRCKA